MSNLEDVIEQIRQANAIEEVAKDLGFKFEREGGKYRRAAHSGGLVLNTGKQRFFWVERAWNGDVFELVGKEKGFDFKAAAEWLADRAGLPRPGWAQTDPRAMASHRARLSTFDAAQHLFAAWLLKDKEALGYVRGRGFSDEVIRESGMGFSGRKSPAEFKEMRGEFSLYGIDPESAAAVAILGFKGDVAGWARAQGVDLSGYEDWISNGWISGMMGRPGVVYAHQWAGRVIYFSRRNLPGEDQVKSFNPGKPLAGVRQPYFNRLYRADAEECAVVEGPADAETWGVWGFAAVALCGVHADDEGIASLKGRLKGHKKLFLNLDADEVGLKKREQVASALGPLTRIVDWGDLTGQDPSAAEAEAEEREPVESVGLAVEAS